MEFFICTNLHSASFKVRYIGNYYKLQFCLQVLSDWATVTFFTNTILFNNQADKTDFYF